MALRDFPTRHPWWWTCICFLVGWLPTWIQSVWGLWSNNPLGPIVVNWLTKMEIPTFSAYWLTIPSGLAMFGWLAYELRRSRRTIATTPAEKDLSISEWVNHETYFVWVAACLWVNIRPVPRIDENSPAYPMLQKIKAALETEKISSMWGGTGMTARVSRTELIKLADFYNEKPKFLFPEDSKESVQKFQEKLRHQAFLNRLAMTGKASVFPHENPNEQSFRHGFNKATFNRNPTREAAALRLAQLRDEGVVIRNDASRLLFTADLEAWVSKVNEWMGEVIEALKPMSVPDSEWFATLHTVPPSQVPIPNLRLGGQEDRALFVSIFRQHDYRLARLDALLKKHEVGA